MGHILAIDQGTTSSRAIVFDAALRPVAQAGREFAQHYPAPGWVEHDPDELFDTCLESAQAALARAGLAAGDLAGIGITNQRETTLLWDRENGRPVHRAIVWQDRRTAESCHALTTAGHEPMVTEKSGLVLDPYFSATKLAWLLDRDSNMRAVAEAGRLAFGTVDSWLIWRLTDGRVHATDATNASRTMLWDIRENRWSPELCALFRIPEAVLPEVRDCAADFGTTDARVLGAAVPILGVAGDQQAAAMGQACFRPGMLKATYGTGCFALLNTGEAAVPSSNRLLTTVAARLDGRTTYALEGAIFVAGAAVQWLRDGLGVLGRASEADTLAARADPAQEVMLVPAFTGLGAPWWAPEARGALFGLTRNAGPAELARAALESAGYQTRDLLDAMRADWPDAPEAVLRVDGGMSASQHAMQFLADILGAPVERPEVLETTALGAAWLAGRRAGLYPPEAEMAARWHAERRFLPAMAEEERARRHARWRRAVEAVLSV
ncbi:glycerol kinase [Rhodosalinus halophilus]|uniref:Glycerol kinase n=1 Tax=Rhodosalinus halophilus TaxID=2259333 RepID=A0A365UBD7_9RHOB|nr:glycerol kinase GlpK [Rhodosalinus halophilus]RBI86551.1 glycerol kinase [Rhodosalinus halophilus]